MASPQGAHGWERKADRPGTREGPGTGALWEPDKGNLTLSPGQRTRVERAAEASQEPSGAPRARESRPGPRNAGAEAGRIWMSGRPAAGAQPLLSLPRGCLVPPHRTSLLPSKSSVIRLQGKDSPASPCGEERATRVPRVWRVLFPGAGERKVPGPSGALRRMRWPSRGVCRARAAPGAQEPIAGAGRGRALSSPGCVTWASVLLASGSATRHR